MRGHKPLSVRKEHYLEAVWSLGGSATLSDVAKSLGVKPSSALKMVKRLEREGLVVYNSAEVSLTEKGRSLVEERNVFHRTLEEFFVLIGVPEELAAEEAEKLEHVVNPAVVKYIARLTAALKSLQKLLNTCSQQSRR